mmetsp:Transcript_11531/g.36554  ORF Transcript_11531/g.36554 Transcript_11531/m.36554 type:complete len:238 (+) Transcript_11531:81-794(+)
MYPQAHKLGLPRLVEPRTHRGASGLLESTLRAASAGGMTHSVFRPIQRHGRLTSIMLSRLMVVAAQDRRILIEVPTKKPRWCNTPPQTLQCFYQRWTNCSLNQKGADVIHVSLKSYHRSRKWYGTNKHLKSMQPTPAQFLFRPNALVQRHVNAVIAQCGGTDYWTVHVRDSPEKRAEMHTKHLPDLQGYVRRLPPNVTRILWQTANPAAFQAILRYSSQRPGLRFCYTNFSRHTEDV